tara:strand:- start:179 stop:433 length:255 start_codon:yes stop_codon:yes gene_type:complete
MNPNGMIETQVALIFVTGINAEESIAELIATILTPFISVVVKVFSQPVMGLEAGSQSVGVVFLQQFNNKRVKATIAAFLIIGLN